MADDQAAIVKNPEIVATEPNKQGYRSFTFDAFKFSRDEYFVHIEWPKGKHTMEVDRFLRAMVRDIGWGFFYGWIFFDDVFGTTNHYGTVDIYAGAYDNGCKAAGIDFIRTYSAESVSKAFETISRDWISEGYDPLRAPLETGTPINRAFADVTMDKPDVEPEPGFEGQLHAINLFDHISRSDVTWNPSVTAVTKASICCVTSEEHMLPVIHGNDRNEWFIQLSDEIHWKIYDKNSGNPRGTIVMKAGDVCAMPADIRHQGFSPKRCMLMVMENGSPELPELYATGKLAPYPIEF